MTIISTITFSGKEFACNAGGAGDTGLTPGSGRSPGEENGNPLQCFCLKNPMDREAWGYSPWGHKESDTTEAIKHSCIISTTVGTSPSEEMD